MVGGEIPTEDVLSIAALRPFSTLVVRGYRAGDECVWLPLWMAMRGRRRTRHCSRQRDSLRAQILNVVARTESRSRHRWKAEWRGFIAMQWERQRGRMVFELQYASLNCILGCLECSQRPIQAFIPCEISENAKFSEIRQITAASYVELGINGYQTHYTMTTVVVCGLH